MVKNVFEILGKRALVRVGQIRTQLSKFIKRWKVEETSARENVFPVLKAITAGLFPNAAILRGDGLYETVRDAVVLQARFKCTTNKQDSPKG